VALFVLELQQISSFDRKSAVLNLSLVRNFVVTVSRKGFRKSDNKHDKQTQLNHTAFSIARGKNSTIIFLHAKPPLQRSRTKIVKRTFATLFMRTKFPSNWFTFAPQ